MKLVIAIIHSEDNQAVTTALLEGGFSATRMSAWGGFLEKECQVLFICADEEKVDRVKEIFRKNVSCRSQPVPGEMSYLLPGPVTVGGATIFVVNVEQFQRM